MKKLFLHVGCGKTGSSALQVWLSRVSHDLEKRGVLYPLRSHKPLSDYAITSGNGVHLHKAIKNRSLNRYFRKSLLDGSHESLLFSSENLQNMSKDDATYLNRISEERGLEIEIIAYVRDVYDMAYSGFQQLVKRHTYTQTFSEFALSRNTLQQFAVVRNFSLWFRRIQLVHYDSAEGGDLAHPLCRIVGVDSSDLPRMEKNKVNRSLTVLETELMLLANRIHMQNSGKQSMKFSASLSDQLIAYCPEQETEILFSEQIYRHFEKTMKGHVEFINSEYFGEPCLQIFRPDGKRVVETVPALPEDLKRFVEMLLVNYSDKKGPLSILRSWANRLLMLKN